MTRYEQRKAMGLCADCNALAVRGTSRCERCAEFHRKRENDRAVADAIAAQKNRSATRRWRGEQRAAGRCISCSATAAPGRARCAGCLARNRGARTLQPLPVEGGC